MSDIIVVVRDGLVQSVYSDNENDTVSVYDFDTDEPDTLQEIENEFESDMDTGKYTMIY